MSSLLPLTAVLGLANDIGAVYDELVRSANVLDIANADCQTILTDLSTNLASADPQQFASLVPYVTGTYGSAPSSSGSAGSVSPFGAANGVGPGLFGSGQGLINRRSVLNGGFFALLEGIRKALATYGVSAVVTNLSTYAAYQNGLTAYSCLFNPDTAALFWYAYNQAQQLAALSVFAPEGIVLASFVMTGSAAGTFTPGCYPASNGYTVAPTASVAGVVEITALNTASLSDAATGGNNAVAYVTTTVNGTAALTVTAPNQDSVSRTFTATLDNLTAGSLVGFVPTVAGDLMTGAPTAVAVTGTATAGELQIVAGGPTADDYGNASWIGGLPMAQGFAPLKNALLAVTADTNGTLVATIAAPNQDGVSKTWVTTITGSQSAGYSTAVIVGAGTAGSSDRIAGTPTDITVTGAGTAGTLQVQSGSPERAY